MIRAVDRNAPKIHRDAFVHDSAEIIGRVELKARASVWPLCVLRGDLEKIVIGERTNIQDLTVIHTIRGCPTIVGRGVTVGHRAVLHGARIGDGTLIGMGAIVMEARVGAKSLVAAGSLVLAGARIPPGSLVMGSPARVVRRLTAGEMRGLAFGEDSYLRYADRHRRTSRVVFPA